MLSPFVCPQRACIFRFVFGFCLAGFCAGAVASVLVPTMTLYTPDPLFNRARKFPLGPGLQFFFQHLRERRSSRAKREEVLSYFRTEVRMYMYVT